MVGWYLYVLRVRKEPLLKITPYVVADTYFSKVTFVNGTLEMGFHTISRLRDDASLRYLTTQVSTGGRGRPKNTMVRLTLRIWIKTGLSTSN